MVDDDRLEQLRRRHRPELFPSRAELLESLTSRSAQRFEAGLDAAVHAGVDGARALVEALEQVACTRRRQLVYAMGETARALDPPTTCSGVSCRTRRGLAHSSSDQ